MRVCGFCNRLLRDEQECNSYIGCSGREAIESVSGEALAELQAKASKRRDGWVRPLFNPRPQSFAESEERVKILMDAGAISQDEVQKLMTWTGEIPSSVDSMGNLKFVMSIEKEPTVEHTFTPAITYKKRPDESGEGLRAQGGKYTEPGNVKIYCDNGNDEP